MHPTLPSKNRILAILGLGMALSLLGDSTLYAVLPDPVIAAGAGLSMEMVGLALGLNRLVRIVTNLPAGWLFDRLPRRGLILAAAGLGTLSTLLYVAGNGPALFLVGRLLWGLAWSGIWVGGNSAALDISSDLDRGAITGRLQMWFYFGIAFSSLAGGVFTDLFSFRGGLWISAGLGAVGFLLWLFFLPETRGGHSSSPDSAVASQAEDAGRGFPWRGFPWREALEAALPYFVLRLVFAGVVSATAIQWLSSYFGRGILLGSLALPLATLSGSFLALRVLVSLAASPLIGAAADRLGNRWSFLAGSLGLGVLGLWAMGSPLPWLALAGALFVSISAGGIPALTAAVIGDRVHSSRHSRSLGIVFSIGDLGSAVGPSLGLALAPLIGLGNVYLLCAGIYAAAGIYALSRSRSTARSKGRFSQESSMDPKGRD